jgi:hypothetical protein
MRRYAAFISPPVAPARSPRTSYSVRLPAGAAEATATAQCTVRRELEAARRKPAAAGACVSRGAEIIAERKVRKDGRMDHECADLRRGSGGGRK